MAALKTGVLGVFELAAGTGLVVLATGAVGVAEAGVLLSFSSSGNVSTLIVTALGPYFVISGFIADFDLDFFITLIV